VADKGRRKRKRVQRRRAPRWLLPVVVLGVMAFLYARPISSYMETRDQLHERRAEVATLRAERDRATARLERATSLDELARAARRIGYVRPGEHLFIVKGTAAWNRRHLERAARGDG
jgi:cell division protein FtsB